METFDKEQTKKDLFAVLRILIKQINKPEVEIETFNFSAYSDVKEGLPDPSKNFKEFKISKYKTIELDIKYSVKRIRRDN